MPAPPPLGPGLVARQLRVADGDVVWLRSVLEGYDGLAALYGNGTGHVWLITPAARAPELDTLLDALAAEIGMQRLPGDLG